MRRRPFIVDGYTFTVGGEDDRHTSDIVNDKAQGLGTPAQSIVIRNDGPGTLYYTMSEDGMNWSNIGSISAGNYMGYDYNDGILISQVVVWSNLANTVYKLVATPGR
jgi:hypothetical protein